MSDKNNKGGKGLQLKAVSLYVFNHSIQLPLMIDVLTHTELFEMLSRKAVKRYPARRWDAALSRFIAEVASVSDESDLSQALRTLTYTCTRLDLLEQSASDGAGEK